MQGAVDHEDFAGNKGTLYPGDLQFMTAGRGIVHAEMPRHDSERGGEVDSVVGMQLWVDLPENLKMCEPRYRDLKGEEIPIAEVDGVTVKVISGRSHGVDSLQELAYTPVWLLDVTIRPGGKIEQRLPKGWNAFAYTYKGDVTFGAGSDKRSVGKWHNVVFEQQGDSVSAEVDADASQEAQFSKLFLVLNNLGVAYANLFVSSIGCGASSGPKDHSVRSVRAHVSAGCSRGCPGLSDIEQWLRESGGMGE